MMRVVGNIARMAGVDGRLAVAEPERGMGGIAAIAACAGSLRASFG